MKKNIMLKALVVILNLYILMTGYILGVANAFKYPKWHYEVFINKEKMPNPFKN